MTTPKVRRGRKAQDIAAKYAADTHHWDTATPAASAPGEDISGIPGLSIEVKATGKLALPAARRQAARNAAGRIPVVLWQPPREGEMTVRDWPAYLAWGDLLDLVAAARGQTRSTPSNKTAAAMLRQALALLDE